MGPGRRGWVGTGDWLTPSTHRPLRLQPCLAHFGRHSGEATGRGSAARKRREWSVEDALWTCSPALLLHSSGALCVKRSEGFHPPGFIQSPLQGDGGRVSTLCFCSLSCVALTSSVVSSSRAGEAYEHLASVTLPGPAEGCAGGHSALAGCSRVWLSLPFCLCSVKVSSIVWWCAQPCMCVAFQIARGMADLAKSPIPQFFSF